MQFVKLFFCQIFLPNYKCMKVLIMKAARLLSSKVQWATAVSKCLQGLWPSGACQLIRLVLTQVPAVSCISSLWAVPGPVSLISSASSACCVGMTANIQQKITVKWQCKLHPSNISKKSTQQHILHFHDIKNSALLCINWYKTWKVLICERSVCIIPNRSQHIIILTNTNPAQ